MLLVVSTDATTVVIAEMSAEESMDVVVMDTDVYVTGEESVANV